MKLPCPKEWDRADNKKEELEALIQQWFQIVFILKLNQFMRYQLYFQ